MMFWRSCILVVVALVNTLLFVRMVWGPTGLMAYRELQQQYESLEKQIADLDAENRNLSREILLLQSDSHYMKKVIRQRLHYVHDNEVLYLFDDLTQRGHTHDGKN